MEAKILEFVHALRKADIRVSLSETLDAIQASSLISLSNRADFRLALQETLIKKRTDQKEFDRLFDLHFGHLGEKFPSPFLKASWLGEYIREENLPISAFSMAVMSGNTGAMELLLNRVGDAVGIGNVRYPLQVGYFSRRISDQIPWQEVDHDLQLLLEALRRRGYPVEEIREMEASIRQNIETLHGAIRRFIQREIEKNASPLQDRLIEESLARKPFSALTEREIEQMREIVARLIRKLKIKISIQERRRRRGKFDIRRTLRRNLQYGGVPMELHYKERKRKKAEIIALCDVSSSVWNASRFMLNLLYALQDQFSKVRSFVFVSDLGEVTRFFEEYEINEAIQKALKEAGIRYYSYTDYGEVLKSFHEDHLGEVNSRTTFIVIGDGRNNHLPSQAWALEAIQERAKRVIWLNPESKSSWNHGDSIMGEYLPYCQVVRECRNFKQLAEFVDELIV